LLTSFAVALAFNFDRKSSFILETSYKPHPGLTCLLTTNHEHAFRSLREGTHKLLPLFVFGFARVKMLMCTQGCSSATVLLSTNVKAIKKPTTV